MWSVTLGCFSILLLSAVSICHGANILAIIGMPSYSHQVAYQPLWKELSARGHKVTVMTTHPVKDLTLTNLTEIDLNYIAEKIVKKYNLGELIVSLKDSPLQLVKAMVEIQSYALDQELNDPLVKKLIRKENNQKFDVILVEFLFPVMYAFAEVYNCPIISISSMDVLSSVYGTMGNPINPVTHPDMTVLQMMPPLNFKQRLTSTLFYMFLSIYVDYVVNPREDIKIKKYFGNHLPTLRQLRNRVSLLFINVDQIFHPVRPLIPSIIPIGGGSHMQASHPLSKDLEYFIGNATEGIIYFSLGSNVRGESIKPSTIKDILEVFEELPYKVIWKIDPNYFENVPKNIYLSKWFPQQTILQSSKVKLFITQGGCQSLDEAIYNHVPILGLPVFGDQVSNVKRMVSKGVGLSLDFNTMTKLSFKSSIVELITNLEYRKKVKYLAQLARDQPMTGLELAVWWTEYVIRHKGASHLRSPFIDLPLYQYYHLDVLVFCLFVSFMLVFVFLKMLRILLRFTIFRLRRKQKVQ